MTRIVPFLACALLGHLLPAQVAPAPPRLGVMIVDGGAGVIIDEVRPGMPAARAGLQRGDRIVRIGETAVETDRDLVAVLAQQKPGQTVALGVVRNGAALIVPVTFAAPALRGSDRAAGIGESLERALRSLDKAGECPQVVEARREIRSALAALGADVPPGLTVLSRSPRGVTVGPGAPNPEVMARLRELSESGRSPREIEEAIRKEFPGTEVKVYSGSGQDPAAGEEGEAPERKVGEKATTFTMRVRRGADGRSVTEVEVRCPDCSRATGPCETCVRKAANIQADVDGAVELNPIKARILDQLRPSGEEKAGPADRKEPGKAP